METTVASRGLAPIGFLQLAGHPLRWKVLVELARSDRKVRELTGLLGLPQSLLSYHLNRLRAGGLVSMRRSSADGRDAYYSVDLDRCGELLAATGEALHPGLRLTPRQQAERETQRAAPVRVLFLCTGNSARSRMAEALLEHLAEGGVEVVSAGSHPKPLHMNAVQVMREQGIDLSRRRSKHFREFVGQRFDFVISLCDRVREICPEFPGHPEYIHWSIADPALEGDSDEETYAAFERTAAELRLRVGYLVQLFHDGSPTQEVN
jgi:ArsR family transcriptional regulator, arsenate/arsenite/antimonite-responsive transcriptional repressor / arsenate reductase (thioredoxin)